MFHERKGETLCADSRTDRCCKVKILLANPVANNGRDRLVLKAALLTPIRTEAPRTLPTPRGITFSVYVVRIGKPVIALDPRKQLAEQAIGVI